MRRLFFFALLLVSMSTCTSQRKGDFDAVYKELKSIEGKYIFDVDIFEIDQIKNRFTKLLGNQVFNEVEECFMTVTPYKVKKDIFYFSGTSKLSYNSCNIAIDMKNNVFHVRIMYDESGEEKVFSEDEDLFKNLPEEILE